MAEGGMEWSEEYLADIPQPLRPHLDLPASALNHSRREELALRLNPPQITISRHGLLKDWRGLAERLGYDQLEIDNFALTVHPTSPMLQHWMKSPNSKLGTLLEALCAMERFDILGDEALMSRIESDIRAHLKREEERINHIDPYQEDKITGSDDPEVDEFENITINETPGNPEFFDAFVCYASSDSEFVQHMISKLENHHGLKLCVPNRDLMGGVAKYPVMAKLIKDRCQKMIIVLSPDFKNSKECDFQTKFAHSLTPGAKEKKLIPVVYKPCQIPDILNHICLLDYTRCDVVDWFWNRLANSLKKDPTMFRRPISAGRQAPFTIQTEPLRRPTTQPPRASRQPHTVPLGGARGVQQPSQVRQPARGAPAAAPAQADNEQMEISANHF